MMEEKYYRDIDNRRQQTWQPRRGGIISRNMQPSKIE